jgi:hypothetical protein
MSTAIASSVSFNRQHIAHHFQVLHYLAQRSGHQGKLVLAAYGEGLPNEVLHFPIGQYDAMTAAALEMQGKGLNVYSPLGIYRSDLEAGRKGGERDVVALLGAVIDGDGDKGKAAPVPPVDSNYTLETSPGNLQHFLFFDRALPYGEAKPLCEALQRATGAECAGDICHVWRVPGALNYPNKTKLERGRSPEPFLVSATQWWDNKTFTKAEKLRELLQPHWKKPREERAATVAGQNKYDNDPAKVEAFLKSLRERGWFAAGADARKRYTRAAKACSYDLGEEVGRPLFEKYVCWNGERDDEGAIATAEEVDERWYDCSSLKPGANPITFGSIIDDVAAHYGEPKAYLQRDRTGADMFKGVDLSNIPSPPLAPEEEAESVLTRHVGKLMQTSAEFVAGFVAPSYLLDGVLQKRFVYALTAATGAGKTAIALRLAAHVALGRKLGDRDVERGRVLYFASENAVDVQARWIAMAEHCGFDVNTIDVHFVSGATKLSEIANIITAEAKATGDLALVIVDTSAATFEGSDENSNVDGLQHAKRMRSLTELQGGPTALVLCHPIKSATNDNLAPRGGGSFVAEIDGNLCARKSDSAVEVHWAVKFRGMDFAPMAFRLDTVVAARLRDAKGRNIPTVLATPIDEAAKQVLAASERSDQDRVLRAIYDRPGESLSEIAKHLGWNMRDGKPYAMRVKRAAERLAGDGLLLKHRGAWALSERGGKELNALDRKQGTGAITPVVMTMPPLPPSRGA